MKINTTRFGLLDIDADEVILFPEGMLGFEECHRWIFVPDSESDAVAWMQCVDRPDVSLAVVSPRRFSADYQARVARRELDPLRLDAVEDAHVLVVVSKTDGTMTLNFKAPVVINLDRRLGRQVVANGPLPVRFEVASRIPASRKIA